MPRQNMSRDTVSSQINRYFRDYHVRGVTAKIFVTVASRITARQARIAGCKQTLSFYIYPVRFFLLRRDNSSTFMPRQ